MFSSVPITKFSLEVFILNKFLSAVQTAASSGLSAHILISDLTGSFSLISCSFGNSGN